MTQAYEQDIADGAEIEEIGESRLVGPFLATRMMTTGGHWFWAAQNAQDPDYGDRLSFRWYADARTLPKLVEELRKKYPEHMRGAKPPWKKGLV